MPAFSMTEILLVDIILNMNTGLPPHLPRSSPKVSVGMNLENETQDWDPKKKMQGWVPAPCLVAGLLPALCVAPPCRLLHNLSCFCLLACLQVEAVITSEFCFASLAYDEREIAPRSYPKMIAKTYLDL